MNFIRKSIGLIVLMLFLSCASDEANSVITLEEEIENTEPSDPDLTASLTGTELDFIEEYEYITFNLAPDSFGASVNEKWVTDIKLFLDGSITDDYRSEVDASLAQFNDLLSAEISFQLVNTIDESNIHLIFGQKEAIREVWPDMFEAIGDINFQGYALYNRDGDFNITRGRIWVRTPSMPLFRHELGHNIGLGHASNSYCSGSLTSNQSFMCSFLKDELSIFDKAIIKTLYNPNVEAGLTFSQLKPIIEELLLTDVILVE